VPSPRARIAILKHEADRGRDYLIDLFAEYWKEDGLDVRCVYGTEFVPADVAILHVDLSIVPDEYVELALRYPVTVNGRITDIRKSTTSRVLLRPDDPWPGPAIVKTDLNCGGLAEYRLARKRAPGWQKITRRLGRKLLRRHSYRIYPSIADVPRRAFHDPRLVVERFIPEREGDGYCIRVYQFLGDRHSCTRLVCTDPIIKAGGNWKSHPMEPDPGIEEIRRGLGFDYGKFDYVVHDGTVVLLDPNKTPGGSRFTPTPERVDRWRARAQGVLSFL
jgi:hypothetical protein